jgi:hypothetical protein
VNTTVTPLQNALDSLERVAGDLEAPSGDEPLALKGILTWSWHAVGLLAYLRLQPQRHLFDAWLQDYLNEGEAQLQIDRDAHWEERERLSYLELLDLLSEEQLPILKPEFYQGWQDRTSRCHGLRRQMAEIIGGGIGDDQRQQLLLLLAAYHRLIRLPASVELETGQICQAFPALLDLVELLLDTSAPEAEAVQTALNRCKRALKQS